MADSSRNVFKPDSDVHITLEDQQKINLFAKYNAKFDEYKLEVKQKNNELKNFDDAEDELILRSDEDAVADVPMLLGDNFIYMSSDRAMETLKKSREKIHSEIKTIEDGMAVLKDDMLSLKSQLYAKFGTHINLENED